MLLRICYNADRQKRYYQYREQNENPSAATLGLFYAPENSNAAASPLRSDCRPGHKSGALSGPSYGS